MHCTRVLRVDAISEIPLSVWYTHQRPPREVLDFLHREGEASVAKREGER